MYFHNFIYKYVTIFTFSNKYFINTDIFDRFPLYQPKFFIKFSNLFFKKIPLIPNINLKKLFILFKLPFLYSLNVIFQLITYFSFYFNSSIKSIYYIILLNKKIISNKIFLFFIPLFFIPLKIILILIFAIIFILILNSFYINNIDNLKNILDYFFNLLGLIFFFIIDLFYIINKKIIKFIIFFFKYFIFYPFIIFFIFFFIYCNPFI